VRCRVRVVAGDAAVDRSRPRRERRFLGHTRRVRPHRYKISSGTLIIDRRNVDPMDAVDHINIDIDDLHQALAFYRDTLGLELLRAPEDFEGAHAMFRTEGGTVVTLMETGRAENWHREELDHPLDKAHLAFETDRETYASLVDELDGQFPKQGPYDWGEFEGFYFLDPSGNLLEIITDDPIPEGVEWPLMDHDDV
jgi:catechol 2,3-dioxygenase-like lactoylglutathione lyase family enzyme